MLQLEAHLSLLLESGKVVVESGILQERSPFGLVELSIITFNSESLNLGLKGWGQSVIFPVLALGVGAIGSITLLAKILVESEDKVAFKDS